MELPTKPQPAERTEPKVLLMYGETKIGKTTILSKLSNCLIIDTEEGTAHIECMNKKIYSIDELRELVQSLHKSDNKYDFIALDTINNIISWLDAEICEKRGANIIGDIPHGVGYDYTTTKIMEVIRELKRLSKYLIIVTHNKKIVVGDKKIEINTEEVELRGKLKSLICADADTIGYIDRNNKSELTISFISNNKTKAGSRCDHLKNKSFMFEWNKIYPNFLKNNQ